MRQPLGDDYRETIWGIDPRDRQWFQLLTLVGGIAGSAILTQLELAQGPADGALSEAARNITLGIGASFVASGFLAWAILQLKELIMSIADWLKEINAKNREKWRQEGLEKGLQTGRQEGRQEGQREAYELGYSDAREGKPKQPPTEPGEGQPS